MVQFVSCLFLAGILKLIAGEAVEVCNGELGTRVRCNIDEIIVVTSAEYGRMELGRCITKQNEFMGCTNDVLPLVDRWCSGRRECELGVPNPDLEKLNRECLEVLIKYLRVAYRCTPVNSHCSSSKPTSVSGPEGIISSSTYDTKGCGSQNSPWIISAQPGQTINISIVDFGAELDRSSLVSCPAVYGYIHEAALGIKHTICSGQNRERPIYTSKTNAVEVEFVPKSTRGDNSFILKYKVTGCPELPRPAHAWYKREGSQAIIGCENNDKEWRLTCVGNKWKGEMGNCSEAAEIIVIQNAPDQVGVDSVVVMTGIAGGAVVLCVVAIVVGTVYIKKYRMRQETKRLMKTYATIGKNTQVCYGPVDLSLGDRATLDKNLVETWDAARDQMMSYPEACTCASLPSQTGSKCERQSLYSSIKSS